MTDPNATGPDTPLDSILDATNADTTAGTSTDTTDDRQRELDEARDKYLRLAAEFENFRRRAVKERQEAGWRAQGELVRGILDALDDLNRFANVDPATIDSKAVVEGVSLVEKKILKSLGGHGFEVIDPTGHPFNPTLHEAVTTTPAASAEEDDVVAACFQAGYVINGHVLRPARVVVKQWTGA
jgi:molecular chaperone GrpE